MIAEKNILAFDAGGKTGWASFKNERLESGVATFALKRGESKGMIYILFNAFLHKILDLIKPDLVIFEQTFSIGRAAQETMIGMNTRIQEACEKRGIDCTFVYPNQLKKYATGSGKANKEDMVKKANDKWPYLNIQDHNQADALFLLQWARDNLL